MEDDDDEDEERTFDDDNMAAFTGDESTCSNRLVVDCDVNNNSSDETVVKRDADLVGDDAKMAARVELDKYEGALDGRKKFFLNTQKRLKMEKMHIEAGGSSDPAAETERKADANRLLGLANVALESEPF